MTEVPKPLAWDENSLKVDGGYTLHYEQFGAPDGVPVVVLHGGPGGGLEAIHAAPFEGRGFRVVMFDQRGCGQSEPHGQTAHNTTWDLIDDVERLRDHLGLAKWMVCGGSWGSALSLLYAEEHPEKVAAILVRSIFTCTQEETNWQFKFGAHAIFPEEWDEFVSLIPLDERNDLLKAYQRRLNDPEPQVASAAALSWGKWEGSVLSLLKERHLIAKNVQPRFADALARLELHYFTNGCFLHTDTQIYDNIDRIRHIPGVIIHGRYDICTPVRTAWRLHRAWPEARYVVLPEAGHVITERGTIPAMIEAAESLKQNGLF
jgi:proline iminopeptidase